MPIGLGSVANLLTGLRIALSPVFIICFMWGGAPGKVSAFVIAGLFEVTDLLDGYLARRFDAVSQAGKLLDPLADRISRFSVFLCLLASDYMPPWFVWFVAVIFYRDALVSHLRARAGVHGVAMAARPSGKIKAGAQGVFTVGVTFLIALQSLGHSPVDFGRVVSVGAIIVMAITAWSGVDYMWGYSKTVRQEAPEGK